MPERQIPLRVPSALQRLPAPGRHRAALLLLGLAAVASLWSLWPRAAPAPVGQRWIAALPDALEVPPVPPREVLLSLAELRVPGAAVAGIAFRAAPLQPFVVRLRPQGRATLRALTEAELARVGLEPVALPGPLPGVDLGPCVRSPAAGCQRLSHLQAGQAGVLLVVEGTARALEAETAELPDPRAPRTPTLTPLVRRLPAVTAAGSSWRTALLGDPGARYVFEVALPPRAELRLALGLAPGVLPAPVRFVVRQGPRVLLDETVHDRAWHDHVLPLEGATARLSLETSGGRGFWADPRVLGRVEAPSILLITMDAVRPDHLSAYGYPRDTSPALQALARTGVRFLRASSQAANTWQSVTSMLSGRQPLRTGVRAQGEPLPATLLLLPDLLAARGYDTWAGSDLASFPPGELSSFDDATEYPAAIKERMDLPRQLRQIAPQMAQRPTLAWLHVENAHYPLRPSEPLRYDPGYAGRMRDGVSESDQELLPQDLSAAELGHVRALYDAAVRDADHVVGQLLAVLEQSGAAANTIVVVSADHGELLGEHGVLLNHLAPWEPVLHVPLLIAWPGHVDQGLVVPGRVQLVDLVPTLLSLAGLPPEPGLDGRDLSPALHGRPLAEASAYAEVARNVQIQLRGDAQLITSPPGTRVNVGGRLVPVRPLELYDLAKDPQGLVDVAALEPGRATAEAAALAGALHALQGRDAEDESPAALGQAALDTLQRAGYLRTAPAP